MFAVSCGQLIKQAVVDEKKSGLAAKSYMDKGFPGVYFMRDKMANDVDPNKYNCLSLIMLRPLFYKMNS